MLSRKVFIGLIILLILSFLVTSPVRAGNDFIVGNLRIDPGNIQTLDYRAFLGSSEGPSGNYPTFTTSWLSVYLDDEEGLYGKKFSQVGIITNSHGIYWFVYAEPGVQCLRGNYGWWNSALNTYLGCYGDIGDLINYGSIYEVELVSYPPEGFWIARVEGSDGALHDVAKIFSDSTTIYQAQVNMEEAWTQAQDPFETAAFTLMHPQYNNLIDGFTDWPVSNNINHNNVLYPYPNEICSQHYGAILNIGDDPRIWYAGTGGNICNAIMFPGINGFLPSIMNN